MSIEITQNKETIDYISKPFEIGDSVFIKVNGSWVGAKIKNIIGNSVELTYDDDKYCDGVVNIYEIKKNTVDIGYNPFKPHINIRQLSYSIESILNMVGLSEKDYVIDDRGFINSETDNFTHIQNGVNVYKANFNPYAIIDGEKVYYQRGLVWDLERKKLFIDSIYNNNDCGHILIRDNIEKQNPQEDYAWYDIVDGKQRITTISDFVFNKFPDSNGYYFKDMSIRGQRKFLSSLTLKISTINCNDISDEEIVKQFVLMNYGGVPQDKEHISYLKSKITNVK